MPSVGEITKLACCVDGDEELIYYRIDLLDEFDAIISTMEYADITQDYKEILKVNEEAQLYFDMNQLKRDLAQAKLNRYMGKGQGKQEVEILITLTAKLKHQNGECKETCIYCNPDLGADPFPDFTFAVKNSTPEGNS